MKPIGLKWGMYMLLSLLGGGGGVFTFMMGYVAIITELPQVGGELAELESDTLLSLFGYHGRRE